MPTVLFDFPTKNDREEFLQLLKAVGETFEGDRGEIINSAMKTIRRDPPIRSNSERRAAIYVAGTQLAQGSVEEMNERFMQECGVHSANVEMREDSGNGVYDKVIRSRKKQAV
jgi:hypothetical protein